MAENNNTNSNTNANNNVNNVIAESRSNSTANLTSSTSMPKRNSALPPEPQTQPTQTQTLTQSLPPTQSKPLNVSTAKPPPVLLKQMSDFKSFLVESGDYKSRLAQRRFRETLSEAKNKQQQQKEQEKQLKSISVPAGVREQKIYVKN